MFFEHVEHCHDKPVLSMATGKPCLSTCRNLDVFTNFDLSLNLYLIGFNPCCIRCL